MCSGRRCFLRAQLRSETSPAAPSFLCQTAAGMGLRAVAQHTLCRGSGRNSAPLCEAEHVRELAVPERYNVSVDTVNEYRRTVLGHGKPDAAPFTGRVRGWRTNAAHTI